MSQFSPTPKGWWGELDHGVRFARPGRRPMLRMRFLSDKGRPTWQPANDYIDVLYDSGASRSCLGSGSMLRLGIKPPTTSIAEPVYGIEGRKRPIIGKRKTVSVQIQGFTDRFPIEIYHSDRFESSQLLVSSEAIDEFYIVVIDKDYTYVFPR